MSKPRILLLDLQCDNQPHVEIYCDGTFSINGEAETRPEVVCKALADNAIAWAKSAEVMKLQQASMAPSTLIAALRVRMPMAVHPSDEED